MNFMLINTRFHFTFINEPHWLSAFCFWIFRRRRHSRRLTKQQTSFLRLTEGKTKCVDVYIRFED